MLTGDHLRRRTECNDPADWRKCLENDNSLTPGLRESYPRTLAGFERFCWQRKTGAAPGGETWAAARPTVGLARDYVELQRLELAPGTNRSRLQLEPVKLRAGAGWHGIGDGVERGRGREVGEDEGVNSSERICLAQQPVVAARHRRPFQHDAVGASGAQRGEAKGGVEVGRVRAGEKLGEVARAVVIGIGIGISARQVAEELDRKSVV